MTRKLTYFDFNGLGESIRYVLMYTRKEFEDDRVEIRTWPDKELQATFPFGQMPIYEENGKVLHQSLAILRYLAAGTELLPSDPWDQAVIDAAVQTAYDFVINYVRKCMIEVDPVRYEKARKALFDEALDYYMSRFEKQLKDNNGWFGGKKLSWADFFFASMIESTNTYLKDNIEKNYPSISDLIKKIHSLPRIKEYVTNRKPYYAYHIDHIDMMRSRK